MNKTAIAILASSLAAGVSAQTPSPSTSVTIYATVDVNVSAVNAGSRTGLPNLKKVDDGTGLGLRASKLGFRGNEDLGDGLRAGFVIESGFNADLGTFAQGGRAWGRQAFVSLSHADFGDVRLGRQYAVGDTVAVFGEPFNGAMVTKTSTTVSGKDFTSLPVWLDSARADNVAQYRTPELAGFVGTVQLAPGEGVNDRFEAVMLQYKNGPFIAAASYEENKSRLTGASVNKSTTAAGSYDFKTLKILGTVQRGRDLSSTSGNGDASGFNFVLPATASMPKFTATRFDGAILSAELPVGNSTFAAEYLRGKFSDAIGHATTLDRIGFGASYALSKRASLYTGLSFVTGDLKDYLAQSRILNAGISVSM